MERLAQAELRSVNAQIEFLLRDALAQRGVKPRGKPSGHPLPGRAPASTSSSPPSSRGRRVD